MDSNDSKTVHASGPGQTLRQARTDLRLSAEDVANQLHLAPRQILALEADDYEHLPQATYVRGYLRNYALFLGLTPEPILDAYNRAAAGRAPKTRPRDVQIPAAEHDGQSKFGSVAVGALILVLVIAWWQGRDEEVPSDAPPTAAAPADNPSQVPADAATAPSADASAPSTAETNASSPILAPNASAPPVTGPTPPPVAASPPQATPETPPKPRPAPANARQARLVIDTTDESWVDVRDARGERLLYETVPAGRTVGLEGLAPFSVFLGNVAGVSVALDGEVYDAMRHKRGNTARFNLGPGPQSRRAVPAPESAPESIPAPVPSAPTAPAAESPAPLLPE